MAAVGVTVQFGGERKSLAIPAKLISQGRVEPIANASRKAFGIASGEPITVVVSYPEGVADEDGIVTMTAPKLLSAAAQTLKAGAVLTVTRGESSATSLASKGSDGPVASAAAEPGFRAVLPPSVAASLREMGLEAAEDDPLGRIFVSLPWGGRRPVMIQDKGLAQNGATTVASRPLGAVMDVVMERTRAALELAGGLAEQDLPWQAVGAAGTRSPAGSVKVLASSQWWDAPGGVLVVVSPSGAPPGVWSRAVCLYGGVRVGCAAELLSRARQARMGVVLADLLGDDGSDSGSILPGAGRPRSNTGASLQSGTSAAAGAAGSSLVRDMAAGRVRRVLRAVMQRLDKAKGSAKGRSAAAAAAATTGDQGWRRMALMAFGDASQAALTALQAETAPEAAAPSSGRGLQDELPTFGVGCAEDSAAVTALSSRRLGAIALVEPAHMASEFSAEVRDLVSSRGVCWVAAMPGKTSTSGDGATARVGDVKVGEAEARFGAPVVALPAPELKPAVQAHKAWQAACAAAARDGHSGPPVLDADARAWAEGTDGERGLVRAVLAPAGTHGAKLTLRANHWRSLTPYRALDSLLDLVDAARAAELPKPSKATMSAEQRRALWAAASPPSPGSLKTTASSGSIVAGGGGSGSAAEESSRVDAAITDFVRIARSSAAGAPPRSHRTSSSASNMSGLASGPAGRGDSASAAAAAAPTPVAASPPARAVGAASQRLLAGAGDAPPPGAGPSSSSGTGSSAPAAPMPWAADAAPQEDQGPTVPPLPAVWGQRVTEAAARLLETVTEPGSWPARPSTMRDGVALKSGLTGLPSSMGQQCFDAPPGAVLRALVDPANRTTIDPTVAEATQVATAVAPDAGGGRMEVTHLKMKSPALMVAARDTVLLCWWTVDEAGRVLVAECSLPMDQSAALQAGASGAILPDVGGGSLRLPASPSGMVRAFVATSGWIIEPAANITAANALPPLERADVDAAVANFRKPYTPQPRRSTADGASACRVTFVVRTEAGGSLTHSMVRGAVLDQSMAVSRARHLAMDVMASDRAVHAIQPVSVAAEAIPAPVSRRAAAAAAAAASRPAAQAAAPSGGAAAAAAASSQAPSGPGATASARDGSAEHPTATAAASAAATEPESVCSWLSLPEELIKSFEPLPRLAAPWLPGEEPPADVSGEWRLEQSKSDGLWEFLRALGVPAAARDAAANATVSRTTIVHEGPSLRVDDVTDFGTTTQFILPDGHVRPMGRGGATKVTAWYGRSAGVGATVARQRAAWVQAKHQEEGERAARAEAEAATRAAQEEAKKSTGWFGGAAPAPAAASATAPAGAPTAAAAAAPAAAPRDSSESDVADKSEGTPSKAPVASSAETEGSVPEDEVAAWKAASVPDELWGYGKRSAMLRVRTELPDDRGVVLEERWLPDRGRMRTVAVLVQDGEPVAAMVRYYCRVPDAKAGASDAIPEEDEEDEEDEAGNNDEDEDVEARSSRGRGDSDASVTGPAEPNLEQALAPWLSAAKRRLAGLKLRSVASREANSPMALIAASLVPPVNLQGTWVLDRGESQTIEPILRALGQRKEKVAAAARVATENGLVLTVRQSTATIEYEERAEIGPASKRGGTRRTLVLDGREVTIRSSKDKSAMSCRAVIAPGDGGDGFTGEGPGAASMVMISYLPRGFGETVEVRRLRSRTVMEQLLLIVREGREAARVLRVFRKMESSSEAMVAMSEAKELRRIRMSQAGVKEGAAAPKAPANRSDLRSRATTMLEAEPGAEQGRQGRRRGSGSDADDFAAAALAAVEATGEGGGADDAAASGAGGSAASGASSSLPSEPCPVDFSGVWRVDNALSEPLDPLLAAMGIPWFLRGMAKSVVVTSHLEMPEDARGPLGRATPFTITDRSSYGDAVQELTLDGVERDATGPDGKPIRVTASVVLPWDPANQPAATAGAHPAWVAALKQRNNFDGMGSGAPFVRTQALLEGGASTMDERRLLEPGRLELKTTFSKPGQAAVTVRRVLTRVVEEDPIDKATARLRRAEAARRARHKEILAAFEPPAAAAAAAGGRGAGAARLKASGVPATASAAMALAPSREAEMTRRLSLRGAAPAISCDGGCIIVAVAVDSGDAEPEVDDTTGAVSMAGAAIVAAIGDHAVQVVDAQRLSCADDDSASLSLALLVPAGAAQPGADNKLTVGLIQDGDAGAGASDAREGTPLACFILPPVLEAATILAGHGRAVLTVRGAGQWLGSVTASWRGSPATISRRNPGSRTIVVSGEFSAAASPGEFALAWAC